MKKKMLGNILLAGSLIWTSLTTMTSASSLGEQVAKEAANYIGYDVTKYSLSYFIEYVFKKEGVQLSGGLSAISKQGTAVSQTDLQAGDIVFFGTGWDSLLAAGIYVGDNKVIVAYSPYKTVKEISLSSSIGEKYFVGARRISSTNSDSTALSVPASQSSPIPTGLSDKIINAGKKYLGTPYEYGSTRSNKKTMDCSEFVMWAYKEGAGLDLGYGGSRTQQKYVMNNGTYTTDLNKLKPGDIMFFMSYKGPKQSDYKGINVSKQSVTHSGIYLGDGKILHTYSKDSGGVRTDNIYDRHWQWRFIGGGSPF